MFDLRYHVASLAAVFVALLVGILVGVGLSGKVDDAEKKRLSADVSDLRGRLETEEKRRANLARDQEAAQNFIERAYPSLIENRLRGKRIALLFAGSVDPRLQSIVERTLADAGARSSIPVRMRALKVPIDVDAIDEKLAGHRTLAPYVGDEELDELGDLLAGELVEGGETPAWDALSSLLVEETAGGNRAPVDGVVVVRTVEPQQGDTAHFLAGLYGGLGDSGVPAVGVERSSATPSAVEVWRRARLSTVDHVETNAGRLALALLLAGAQPGRYGLKEEDSILPPVEPPPASPGG